MLNAELTEADSPRLVLCEACGSEGRIIVRTIGYEPGCGHAHNYGERDDGECPCCQGAGDALIATYPVTLEDLETIPTA